LSYFQNIGLTIVALVIFIVVFIGLLVWVIRKSGKEYYERMGQVPLDDEQDESWRATNE
jgi:cbb3-type cytochrome oxidase subunit 3